MSDDDSNGECREGKRGARDILPAEWYLSDQLDTVFSVLSDRRRRYILYYLSEISGKVAERSQLVETIRYCEGTHSESAGVPAEKEVVIDLHHNQFPRLEDAGIIEYDRRQGTVRYTERPAIEEWLDHAYYKETGRAVGNNV